MSWVHPGLLFENTSRAMLSKRSSLKNKEHALAALTSAKRQMRKPRRLIEQVCVGTVSEHELRTVLLHRIHAGCAELGDGGRRALLRLLLHVERHADLLSTAWGSWRWGRRQGNTLIDGLVALANHHADWLRPVDSWKPHTRNQSVQFGELARHLLARYEVPAFMDTVWFSGNHPDAQRQRGWYTHIGCGQNIRTADVPIRLSKRMAHEFLSAPDDYTVEGALRWGQILGQKGSPSLVQAIVRTRLGSCFEEDTFWNSVLLFLIRHPELDASTIGHIVAYIHHRKFEPQDVVGVNGEMVKGPAPEPNFSMKSRSVRKLLRQVKRYCASRTAAPEIEETPSTKHRCAHFYHEETDERSGRTLYWSIQELQSTRSLANEGEAMHHCVGSFGSKLGGMAIWSVQVRDGETTHRVLTVAIDLARRVVKEARGRFNANPAKEFDAAEELQVQENSRSRGRLNATDRYFLARSYRVLNMWLEREGVEYVQNIIG